uniref:Uncharacterized protein n=1 Tax=Oryza punctata TaxID=4537 RepID=A0A0E0JJ62_ORYPU
MRVYQHMAEDEIERKVNLGLKLLSNSIAIEVDGPVCPLNDLLSDRRRCSGLTARDRATYAAARSAGDDDSVAHRRGRSGKETVSAKRKKMRAARVVVGDGAMRLAELDEGMVEGEETAKPTVASTRLGDVLADAKRRFECVTAVV